MRLVVPSVGYADFLAVTLPAWRRAIGRAQIVVVTTPADSATIAIAQAVGVGVCATEVWTQGGRAFDKGAALDEAFGFAPGFTAPPRRDEICWAIDADVYPFGRLPKLDSLRSGVLFSCPRYDCPSPAALAAHIDGQTKRRALALIPPMRPGHGSVSIAHSLQAADRAARRCLGYCQLFRYREGLAFGHSATAGGYDLRFREHFAARGTLGKFYVLHLGTRDRKNWSGRTVPAWPEA